MFFYDLNKGRYFYCTSTAFYEHKTASFVSLLSSKFSTDYAAVIISTCLRHTFLLALVLTIKGFGLNLLSIYLQLLGEVTNDLLLFIAQIGGVIRLLFVVSIL